MECTHLRKVIAFNFKKEIYRNTLMCYSFKICTYICTYNGGVEVCGSLGIRVNNFDHRRNQVRTPMLDDIPWGAGAEMELGMHDLLPFEAAWRDLESIMLSEISQSEKVKYHMISLIWGIQ